MSQLVIGIIALIVLALIGMIVFLERVRKPINSKKRAHEEGLSEEVAEGRDRTRGHEALYAGQEEGMAEAEVAPETTTSPR